MSRAVYVGGFGSGRSCAEGVAEDLGNYYEDIDAFTFSDAVRNPENVRKAVAGVDVITHSAGMLALKSTSPETITAFNAPIPTSRMRIIGRTGAKMYHLHMPKRGLKSISDIPAVAKFDVSAGAELAAHPIANFRPLLSGEIPKFDAIQTGIQAVASYIPTKLVYTFEDDYFKPAPHQIAEGRRHNVDFLFLDGEHDELLLRSKPMLEQAIDPVIRL